MTLSIDAVHDLDALTLTVTAVLDAAPERAWQLWADPRQLERWWGPPTYPATFTEHELVAGRRTSYHMTGPDGEKMPGWWIISDVDEPRSLRLEDGFSDDEGKPVDNLPISHMTVTFAAEADGSVMTIVSSYADREGMQQMLDMGMQEGMSAAVGQIEAILGD